jgi:hypothetical protein
MNPTISSKLDPGQVTTGEGKSFTWAAERPNSHTKPKRALRATSNLTKCLSHLALLFSINSASHLLFCLYTSGIFFFHL